MAVAGVAAGSCYKSVRYLLYPSLPPVHHAALDVLGAHGPQWRRETDRCDKNQQVDLALHSALLVWNGISVQ